MRRTRSQHEATVSLFPFLAVLICTMGALIVLLVVVVQQARAKSDTSEFNNVASKPAEFSEEDDTVGNLQQWVEDQRWQAEMLRQSREQTSEELADARLRLSHLEDHIRRLRDDMKMLADQAYRLKSEEQAVRQDQTAQGLQQLRQDLLEAEKSFELAKQAAAQRPRSYALVPYDGKNGTKRRPIYVECLVDRVVVQPEGIELNSRDFAPPLGNGNPLAAVLRATREFWASHDQLSDKEPYPLLVVRPGGIESYAAARMAMRDWDDEFGYELLSDDVKLSYPPKDIQLEHELQNAVELARQRKRSLILAAPGRFGRLENHAFSDGLFGGSGESFGDYVEASRDGRLSGGAPSNGTRVGHSSGNGLTYQRQPTHSNGFPTGNSPGNGSIKDTPSTQLKEGQVESKVSQGPSEPDAGQRTSRRDETTDDSTKGGAVAGRSANGSEAKGSTFPGTSTFAAGATGGRGVSSSSNGKSTSVGTTMSMARLRGRNWAVPKSRHVSTGITRPISVIVQPNRLVVMPDRTSDANSYVIDTKERLLDSIDELVEKVQHRMTAWGMAGPNVYWKPVLHVQVAPGGDSQFSQLQSLMQNSGINVRRKTR